MGSLQGRYQGEIIKGVAEEAKKNGINLISYAGNSLNNPHDHQAQSNIIYDWIDPKKIQGIISISGSLGNFISKEELLKFLDKYKQFKIVSLGMSIKELPSITIDNAMGIRLAMEHFVIHHGFRTIAYLGGRLGNIEAEIRLNTYLDTLKILGLKINPQFIFHGDFTFNSGIKIARQIIESGIKPQAFLAANDEMALGLIAELKQQGWSIPKDLAVIGFDNIEEGKCITPPLTTVHQPIRTLGIQAVRILLDAVQNQEMVGRIELPTRLEIRQSCGCSQIYHSIVSKTDNMESSPWNLETLKKNLIPILVKEMESRFSDFDNAMQLFMWAKGMVEMLFNDLDQNSKIQFSSLLESILQISYKLDIAPVLWYSIINILFETIKNIGASHYNRQHIDTLWRQSLENIGAFGIREESAFRLISYTNFSDIQQTNQKLSQAFSYEDLINNLNQQIPKLGISHFYVALYKHSNEAPDIQFSRVFYALNKNSDPDQTIAHNQFFQSIELYPHWSNIAPEPFHFLLLPLYFNKINLGYVLIEKLDIDNINYQLLASQLSSSIMGGRFQSNLEKSSVNFQDILKAKTEDLNKTSLELKNEIIQREQTETELINERERALVTLETIGDGVIAADNTGLITYLNPAAEELTGWLCEAAKGMSLTKVLKTNYSLGDQKISKTGINETSMDMEMTKNVPVLLTSRNGRVFSIQESTTPIKDQNNKIIGSVIVLHNISDKEKLSKELNYKSSHDNLTGLLNRKTFEKMLQNLINSSKKNNEEHILCYIDVDKFSIINTNESSLAGDQMLIQLSKILQSSVRTSDFIGRLGGDQFGIILSNCEYFQAKRIIEELHQKISTTPFLWNNKEFSVKLSIGLTPINKGSDDLEKILSSANIACVFAKKNGGNRIQLYQHNNSDLKKYQYEMSFIADIQNAIKENRLLLYSQIIQPISDFQGTGKHYEILIRMIDKKGELLSPSSFISTAEKHNIMPLIDRWTINKLFSSYKIDYNETPRYSLAKFSINLSGASLNDENFLEYVFDQFALYDIPPFMICFEITETTAISNLSRIAQFIKELKKIGVCFSLDDFGTGWSSFHYLKELPIDFLKIDGSFVRGICDNPLDLVLVETINHIGHILGLQTIAEYVENTQILEKLKAIGVNYAQGFGIGIPKPLEL
ncbi:MAG: EAL domain-containing protein [Spirochaetales bacterium]|nr:EAL domain-containing protein [Spirochaetales bacterium]